MPGSSWNRAGGHYRARARHQQLLPTVPSGLLSMRPRRALVLERLDVQFTDDLPSPPLPPHISETPEGPLPP
jgi:hypothetical protein